MIGRIKCYFGYHNYKNIETNLRQCDKCKNKMRFIGYGIWLDDKITAVEFRKLLEEYLK